VIPTRLYICNVGIVKGGFMAAFLALEDAQLTNRIHGGFDVWNTLGYKDIKFE
jgi:hypothetical protein